MKTSNRPAVLAFSMASILVMACSGGGGGGTDAGMDPGSDMGAETGPDVVLDSMADPGGGTDTGSWDVGSPLEPVTLVSAGQSSHVIVLEPGASPSEVWASEELQTYLRRSTGVVMPIVDEAPTDGTPLVVLGQGQAALGLGVDPDPVELGEQGFVIRTVPPHVVIAGTPDAGTLYGVHRFLEDVLGVRWTAPGVTVVPPRSDLVVPGMDRLVTPAFLWRHTSYRWPGKDDAFRAHVTDNSGSGGADHPYGTQHSHDGRAHSYFWYVSPGEFFDEHPEYFSEIGGVRLRDETQLCLTNPDVLDIVTERMLKRMEDKPNDRQHNFSQKDYYNYCTCDNCSAMNEKYGTAGGTQFWFVNELAKRTSKVHPDKLIGTLAYMYTEEPPKDLEMHPNTAVWLCHMYPSCDSHPIDTCPVDADYKRRAEAWSEISDHLYIWHYIVDFTHYYNPFPNFTAMASDMRFYRDIGVEGIYLQGMGASGGGGEFSLLRPYLGLQLLWDPDRDADALIKGFLQDYYGWAWAPIHEWIQLIHYKVSKDNVHMHLYTNPAQGYLPDEIVYAGEALFDEAEALVMDDPVLLDRVQVARMPLVYARIFPRNGYVIEDGLLKWLGEVASIDELMAFVDRMEAHGFQSIQEMAGDPQNLVMLYAILGADQDVVTIENDQLAVDVVPALAGRALRIRDKASGLGVTAWNNKQVLFFPFHGGLEDRVGDGFKVYGWVEPAIATNITETSLGTSLTTLDGYPIQRVMSLDDTEPILYVKTTVTNPGSGPVAIRLRSHLELDLGDLAQTRVKFQSLAGDTVDEDMTEVIAGLREGKHFYDQDVPADSWTFSGTKGLKVIQGFDNQEIDQTWLYAYPDTLNELEIELWAHRVTLEPGESVSLEQSVEVRVE